MRALSKGRAQNFTHAGYSLICSKKQLTTEERRELVDIVDSVARIDGPTAAQSSEIENLKWLVGLVPAA